MSGQLTICDGKYTFILHDDDHKIEVRRYDKDCLWIEQGDNVICTLILYALKLEEELKGEC